MRSLIVSDLHLGARSGADVLRRPGPLAALCEAVGRCDRLVLLGDLVELRQGPARRSMAAAEPVLRALGEALGAGTPVVLVPGNHDHVLLRPWLEARAARTDPGPLAPDEPVAVEGSPLLERLAAALAPAELSVAYPGVWLRDDVYATHGHYLDRLMTLPSFERLAAGAMARMTGPVPAHGATPDDFEAGLAPLYAFIDAVAQLDRGSGRTDAGLRGWQLLTARGRRPLRARAAQAAFPVVLAGLRRAGLGPLDAGLTGEDVRRAGVRGMGEVVARMDLGATHVVFGHTHRAGPLPGEDLRDWRAPTGATLTNGGSWLDEAIFDPGGPEGPYWGGRATWVDATGPPRLERLVTDLGGAPHPKR